MGRSIRSWWRTCAGCRGTVTRAAREPAISPAALLEVFAGGEGLFAGAELAGERLRVVPVLFHLMWRGYLVAGLPEGPLGPATLVRTGE